ncbi:hypothetical protein [Streptomyces mobaraensis]|uniref:Uncharacterized protein n=1 Tax=Streptomyces mobaraensis TaxID=35621 RepID=A0A5N5W1L4_STRMB|nr:hypothetical protein [Streptomyces mobaraensis]KAB7835562.1 hypothetical protein FRZ00_27135 [Streptomyces mobaraensis]
MTESVTNPAEQAAAALAADFPGLRQSHPRVFGAALTDVQLEPGAAGLTARYAWELYTVYVHVSQEDHLNRDDPKDQALHREIRAHATLLATSVTGTKDAKVRGHVEWPKLNQRPEMIFPTAYTVAPADCSDPRFASAVLVTVGMALDYARIATQHAVRHAAEAAEVVRWGRECPQGTRLSKWLREKKNERSAAHHGSAGGQPGLME